MALNVLEQFEQQAVECEKLGSPFTARLCRLLAQRLDHHTGFGSRILDWPGEAAADNVALRACGALHSLARTGWDPDVTSVFPPAEASDQLLWVAIGEALHHQDAYLTTWLDSAPQTNEVARSSILLGVCLTIARVTAGLPLALFEIGASAGLNLNLDAYHYNFREGRLWGDPAAPVSLTCEWRGHSPSLDNPLHIESRAGCDRLPIDARLKADRERLLAYIWAD